jgi:hypothetical protein
LGAREPHIEVALPISVESGNVLRKTSIRWMSAKLGPTRSGRVAKQSSNEPSGYQFQTDTTYRAEG